MGISDVMKQAQWELDLEEFEAAVEKEKERLRTHIPWHARLFPWRITFERR